MLQRLLLLAVAGALGTFARYGLGLLVQRRLEQWLPSMGGFPWGTAAVNAAGCFAAGVLWECFRERFDVNPETRLIVFTGFLGAFTTFSAYVLESSQMAAESKWLYLGLNVAGQNVLGFLCFFAGIYVARCF